MDPIIEKLTTAGLNITFLPDGYLYFDGKEWCVGFAGIYPTYEPTPIFKTPEFEEALDKLIETKGIRPQLKSR